MAAGHETTRAHTHARAPPPPPPLNAYPPADRSTFLPRVSFSSPAISQDVADVTSDGRRGFIRAEPHKGAHATTQFGFSASALTGQKRQREEEDGAREWMVGASSPFCQPHLGWRTPKK